MSTNIRNHFQVEAIDDEAGKRLRLVNGLGDEATVEYIGDPRVSEFARQSVITDDRYSEIDWEQRPVWAAEEAAKCVEELAQVYGLHFGGGNQGLEDEAGPNYAPEQSSMPGTFQTSDGQYAHGYSHEYLSDCNEYPVAYGDDVAGQTCPYASMDDGNQSAPAEAVGFHYPDVSMTGMEPLSPALTDEMDVNQPTSAEDASEPEKSTASQGPNTKAGEDADMGPFVAEMVHRFSEAEWQFLVRICAEHFENDLRKVEENGGGLKLIKNGTETTRSDDHKTQKELMIMTLLDPRVQNSGTDYTVTFRQFNGQLWDRMLVGWTQEVIEHTRHAIATNCFDKPQKRKDRRVGKTGKTSKSKTGEIDTTRNEGA